MEHLEHDAALPARGEPQDLDVLAVGPKIRATERHPRHPIFTEVNPGALGVLEGGRRIVRFAPPLAESFLPRDFFFVLLLLAEICLCSKPEGRGTR